jgi:hypothetical protein
MATAGATVEGAQAAAQPFTVKSLLCPTKAIAAARGAIRIKCADMLCGMNAGGSLLTVLAPPMRNI